MSVHNQNRLLLVAVCSLLPCCGLAQDGSDVTAAAPEVAETGAAETGSGETAVSDEASEDPELIPDAVIVVGAPGTEEYGKEFADAAAKWRKAFETAGLRYCMIGGIGEAAAEQQEAPDEKDGGTDVELGEATADDKTRLLERLRSWAGELDGRRWLVLIGHGTSNRQGSNFNLVGPDISDTELRDALAGGGPAVVVCGFSSSGGWVPTLAASDRVVIAATKGPEEYNYSRFGGYFATAIADAEYDLDHDLEVSLLEAFLAASRETERFYTDAGRIASEHAILEDNGDAAGTTADFYEGLEAVKQAAEGKTVDGQRAAGISLVPAASQPTLDAQQLARRDALEAEFRELRGRKASMTEDQYYTELERVFRGLAEVYIVVDAQSPEAESAEIESPELEPAETESVETESPDDESTVAEPAGASASRSRAQ